MRGREAVTGIESGRFTQFTQFTLCTKVPIIALISVISIRFLRLRAEVGLFDYVRLTRKNRLNPGRLVAFSWRWRFDLFLASGLALAQNCFFDGGNFCLIEPLLILLR